MSTARDLVEGSLRLIGVLASGENISGDAASDGLEVLNDLLESWSIEGVMVYQTVREVFTLATSKQTYTMGVAGDFNTSRPVEILDANYVQSTLETPIKLITDHQWAAIPIKNMSGIPQKLYVDGASTLQNLNFWPYPAAGNQVVIYSKKQLSSIALIGDTLDFPPGYKKALKYNLAGELALEYGKTINPVLGAIAAESKAAIARKNKRPIYMSPDITTSRKRRYRMETGE